MKILLASDHAGFELKQYLINLLRESSHNDVVDMGPQEHNPDDDYPDFIAPLAHEIAKGDCAGIVIGGSGQGEAMAGNRIKGVRAAVYYGGDLEIVRLARQHNDANVLSLGARFLNESEAAEAVRVFLNTSFSQDERHVRRLAKF